MLAFRHLAAAALLALPLLASGGEPAGPEERADNGFLVEEAYNQEPGFVQHVATFQRAASTGEWLLVFSDEWAIHGQAHQLSASLGLQHVAEPRPATGVGDVAINYRYQLVRSSGRRVVLSPRLTAILPTGDFSRGLGLGALGLELQFPLSVLLGERFASHSNLGGTWIPGGASAKTGWAAGQSLVWLARRDFNLLAEALYEVAPASGAVRLETSSRLDLGAAARVETLTLDLGFRHLVDLGAEKELVWGLALPFGLGPSSGDVGFFLYLSFEHSTGWVW